MIAVVNYGMGNIGSILNMLHRIGVDAIATSKKSELIAADKIILPGVGTFDTGMQQLEELGLDKVIKEEVLRKNKPILGICLGMQILGTASEEGEKKGLALIDFQNVKFHFQSREELKIPHMGWDMVRVHIEDDPFLYQIQDEPRYYFVHSYHAVCKDKSNVSMTCEYGYEFTAAVKKDNIYGTQFHPEKSHKFGMRLMENFARYV